MWTLWDTHMTVNYSIRRRMWGWAYCKVTAWYSQRHLFKALTSGPRSRLINCRKHSAVFMTSLTVRCDWILYFQTRELFRDGWPSQVCFVNLIICIRKCVRDRQHEVNLLLAHYIILHKALYLTFTHKPMRDELNIFKGLLYQRIKLYVKELKWLLYSQAL